MSDNVNTATIDNKNVIPKQPSIPTIIKFLSLIFRIGNLISPKLAGCAAYKLWITPPRFKMPESERNALKTAVVEQNIINERTIASYRWGTSDKLILMVHGWSGRGTQLGSFVEPLITAGFSVLSFDAPAHGQSSGKQTNIYEIAECILALDKKFGSFDSIITHSFGGPCLAIAMKRGLKTSRVVNISPPSETEGLVKKFTSALRIPDKTEKELMRCIESKYGKDIWEQTSMANNVRDLDTPAMVIHDVDDVDVPWHEGQAIAKAWCKVRFIKTSKLGHRRILRDPETIETTVDFIRADIRHLL